MFKHHFLSLFPSVYSFRKLFESCALLISGLLKSTYNYNSLFYVANSLSLNVFLKLYIFICSHVVFFNVTFYMSYFVCFLTNCFSCSYFYYLSFNFHTGLLVINPLLLLRIYFYHWDLYFHMFVAIVILNNDLSFQLKEVPLRFLVRTA